MSRLIPCLDVDRGRVVKGVRFRELRDAGDPVQRARDYQREGADELVLLDVSATLEGRAHALDCVRSLRRVLSIPLTVGGGLRCVADARELLAAGADKLAVNSAAVERPELLSELSERFGRQCVVLALDATRVAGGWEVLTRSGNTRTGLDALAWMRRAEALGAGELLLTSLDRDGTGQGYDLELLRAASADASIPIIASGGASSAADLELALEAGASAVLLASLLHDGRASIDGLKRELAALGREVRS